MTKYIWLAMTAVFCCAGITGCSNDDPAIPLPPPTLEEGEKNELPLKDENYNKYIGNDVIGEGIANYYLVLSSTECKLDERGFPMPVADGDMLVIDLYATPSTGEKITIPEGSYRIGFKQNPFTFNIDNTMIIRNREAKLQYEAVTGGTVTVTNDASGNSNMDCELELANGTIVYYHFAGSPEFEDITDTWGAESTLKVDMIDTKFTDVQAFYYGNMFETATGNFMVYFYTDGFADDMQKEGSMLALCLFSNLANNPVQAKIEDGEYKVVPLTEGYGPTFTLMGGIPINGTPFGTYALKVDADGYSGTGFIDSGVVKVSRETNTNNYTFEYELLTDNKKKVSGSITKELIIEDMSDDGGDAFISNLEEDINTNLPEVQEATWTWKGTITGADNKQLDLWSVWLQASQGDAMIFEFATDLGLNGQIPDGTYTTDTHSWAERFTTSTAVAGYLWDGAPRGCWYLHFREEEGDYFHMDINAPAIEEGTVTVQKQADGNFKFEWNFIDDAPGKHKITGNWTGPLRAYNPDIDGEKVLFGKHCPTLTDWSLVQDKLNEKAIKLNRYNIKH